METEDIHVGLETFFGKQNAAAPTPPLGTPVGSPLLEENSTGAASRSREDVRDVRHHAKVVLSR